MTSAVLFFLLNTAWLLALSVQNSQRSGFPLSVNGVVLYSCVQALVFEVLVQNEVMKVGSLDLAIYEFAKFQGFL